MNTGGFLMNSFSFHNPTRIHFGAGQISVIGKEIADAGLSRVLLIAGSGSIKTNGVYKQVTESLQKHGITWVEGWGVQANPTVTRVRELIAVAKQENVQAVLAVGGGSVIDTGKSVAAGFFLNDVWNAFCRKEEILQALPIYTVLTISATGSEMNGNAVITNPEEQKKWAIASPVLYPTATVIDPGVQCSLPFQQTVNGALDATAHILEYYFVDTNPLVTLRIDESILRTIIEMTDLLKANPCDLVARGNLAWSATLALNGISSIGLKGGDWACHQIEHALSALYPKISHGEGLGVIFPAWIEFMSEREPAKFHRWSREVWQEDNPSRALRRFRDKIEAWGSAGRLRDLGIRKADLSKIVDIIMVMPIVGSISRFTASDIESLLMLAY